MKLEICLYDGYAVFNGGMRYVIHPKLGLMWSVPDVMRLAQLTLGNAGSLRAYAPDHVVNVGGEGERPVGFASHPVVMRWLKNRPRLDYERSEMIRFAALRKFPIADEPEGMPDTSNRARQRALKQGVSDEDMRKARMQENFHYGTVVGPHDVRILWRSGLAYLAWGDVCRFLPETCSLGPSSPINRIEDFFPGYTSSILRINGRTTGKVTVVRPEFFVEVILRIWARDAYDAMIQVEKRYLRDKEGAPLAYVKRRWEWWDYDAQQHALKPNRFQFDPKYAPSLDTVKPA